MDDLQRIVDSLGRSVGRAVALQDRQGRMLAYNSHEGSVDAVRTTAILTRRGPDRPRKWARSFGIDEAVKPVRIPANRELGMEARVCAPIRIEGRLLGFLWLIDPEQTLSDAQLQHVAAQADAAALIMHTQALRGELVHGRGRELLRDLISEQEALRDHAATELLETGLLNPLDCAVSMVVRPVRSRSGMTAADGAARERVEQTLHRVRDAMAGRRALTLVRPDHGTLLVTATTRDMAGGEFLQHTAETLLRTACEEFEGTAWRPMIGVGETVAMLNQAHSSYRHARLSAEIAGVDRALRSIVHWNELGVYQLLAQLPLQTVRLETLHPALGRLMATREGTVWIHTLEVFLDLAGDARTTAKRLNVQRGSLYHRLHRIEELGGIDLSQGSDRLALHVGIKVGRLAGLLDGNSPD